MSAPLTFLLNFLRQPTKVGAVLPSSPALARQITSWVGIDRAQAVAEFGPGTGAFTGHIIEKLPRNATFFAIELNDELCGVFRSNYPQVRLFNDSVGNVRQLMRSLDVESLDAIVCGLPWASFGPGLQRELLAATYDALRPGGRFVTFAYTVGTLLPAGRRFRALLGETFPQVTKSPVVWGNIPPAFVYQCEKPLD